MSEKTLNLASLKFSKSHNEEFYRTLRKRVTDHFKSTGKSRFANSSMVMKTVAMLCMYFIPFAALFVFDLSWWTVLLWALMGFGMAGIGLSIMHDANHNAYSKKAWVNKWVGYVILFVGGNDVNWRIQHNVLHHTYTNVSGVDEDISVGAIMRFSPHEKRRKGHKYQHIYAWFLYGLMTIMWSTVKDYKQAIRYKKLDLLGTQGQSLGKMLTYIIISKIAYFAIFLVLPLMYAPEAWYIHVIGFIVMQYIAGLVLSLVFQPAHVVPSSNYPVPDESGNIEADWAVSQLFNTANFAPKARLLSWYVGGLNYQVEHHLFPNICHVHYRKLSKIVKETALEYDLPYNSFKTFGKALREHGRMLYNLGNYDDAPAIH